MKASHAPESGAFEIEVVPAAGIDMRREFRYDAVWAKLKAGAGREDVVMTFPSRLDAKRATEALRWRAKLASLRLKVKRVARAPVKMRYRLIGETK